MTDAVETYFEQHFGKWSNRAEYQRTVPNEPPTWVYEWPRSKHAMSTFTTVGYSRVPIPGVGASHRVEFMLSAKNTSLETAANILLIPCATPLDDGLPIQMGHSIGPLQQPIGAGMTRLFLTDPWEPEPFGTIDLGNCHAEILMVVPLYESEFRLLREEGEEVFWQAFEREALDITNLKRPPMRASRIAGFKP